jgi:hypothetical protein
VTNFGTCKSFYYSWNESAAAEGRCRVFHAAE